MLRATCRWRSCSVCWLCWNSTAWACILCDTPHPSSSSRCSNRSTLRPDCWIGCGCRSGNVDKPVRARARNGGSCRDDCIRRPQPGPRVSSIWSCFGNVSSPHAPGKLDSRKLELPHYLGGKMKYERSGWLDSSQKGRKFKISAHAIPSRFQ